MGWWGGWPFFDDDVFSLMRQHGPSTKYTPRSRVRNFFFETAYFSFLVKTFFCLIFFPFGKQVGQEVFFFF